MEFNEENKDNKNNEENSKESSTVEHTGIAENKDKKNPHHSDNDANSDNNADTNPVNPAKKENFDHPDMNPKIKKINWKKLGPGIVLVGLIIALLIWHPWSNLAGQEILNLTYSIELEDGFILDSNTNQFITGNVASSLGFETSKLDDEISAMQIGKEKIITLEPKDAYGTYDEKLIFSYNKSEKNERESEINRTKKIMISDFTQAFNEQPIVDKKYKPEGALWDYKVLEKDDNYVTLSQEASVGQEIPAGFFVYKVIKITPDKITLKIEGEDSVIPTPLGDLEIKFTDKFIITTLTPKTGEWIELSDLPKARVTGMDENYIFLDANHELAGENVLIKITINKKFREKTTATGKAVIEGAPTMQVFIMSYCPFGLQMLKGILPVMEKFENKANIELRFVGYVMHGEKEEQENYRMICIREEQYSKLVPYLKCFAESDDPEKCIIQANVDRTKLDNCMANNAEQYYEEDKKLCDKYGVRSSPTTVINGEVAEKLGRSPNAIKTGLCDAFTIQPAECSETLSTESPTPGFGSGTSDSSNGVC